MVSPVVVGRWMGAFPVDFYDNVVAIAAWVWYKESNIASRLLWIVLLICFGSFLRVSRL
uniref:Uncharacterized protein n=1 Tax=Physcomitrium patens TaxID=3218 RepID=A0A2K1J147_PHYPA|nr:hypothetical protein PHYPA_023153 [Physcomitrium patens]